MMIRRGRGISRCPAVRPRGKWALLGAVGLIIGVGFQGELTAPSKKRLALDDPGDAAVLDSLVSPLSCGRFPPVGCCEGEALWWCEGGLLQSLNCAGRPHCGWSNAGFFDCNTSGQSDPAGNYSRSCPRNDAGNSSLPPLDAGGDGKLDACGDVPVEGCCAGDQLRYCLGGELLLMDCILNLACGWKANGGLYDCGTEGGEDPSGIFVKACPGSPDAQADLLVDHGPADGGGDTAGDTGTSPGCACSLPASAAGQGTFFTAGMLLLWGFHRRDRRG